MLWRQHLFFFISWRLITLQYCSSFCHTLTWISHGFTCIPHPDLPSHLPLYPIPLGLPSEQVRALVSCIQPGLVICFTLDNIHVLRQHLFLNFMNQSLLSSNFSSAASSPPIHCWWEYKIIQPLYKRVWQFLTHLKIVFIQFSNCSPRFLPYWVENLRLYKNLCVYVCSSFFQYWQKFKQLRCPSTGEWVSKQSYISI